MPVAKWFGCFLARKSKYHWCGLDALPRTFPIGQTSHPNHSKGQIRGLCTALTWLPTVLRYCAACRTAHPACLLPVRIHRGNTRTHAPIRRHCGLWHYPTRYCLPSRSSPPNWWDQGFAVQILWEAHLSRKDFLFRWHPLPHQRISQWWAVWLSPAGTPSGHPVVQRTRSRLGIRRGLRGQLQHNRLRLLAVCYTAPQTHQKCISGKSAPIPRACIRQRRCSYGVCRRLSRAAFLAVLLCYLLLFGYEP